MVFVYLFGGTSSFLLNVVTLLIQVHKLTNFCLYQFIIEELLLLTPILYKMYILYIFIKNINFTVFMYQLIFHFWKYLKELWHINFAQNVHTIYYNFSLVLVYFTQDFNIYYLNLHTGCPWKEFTVLSYLGPKVVNYRDTVCQA